MRRTFWPCIGAQTGEREVGLQASHLNQQTSHPSHGRLQLLSSLVAADGDVLQPRLRLLLRLAELRSQLLRLPLHLLDFGRQALLNQLLTQLIRSDLLLQTEQFFLTGSADETIVVYKS